MTKFAVTITYFNDYKGEWVTVPLSEAPDELINPSATVADIAEMHAEMCARLQALYDADQTEYQEWYFKQQEAAQKAAEIERAYEQRYA